MLVSVNGTELYCEQAGTGEPVVLVHGGGGDRRYWDGQFAQLARHFSVLRYDLRGYGRSADPVVGQGYRHEDDLNALLQKLNIDQAHIAGYSLGCQIAVDTYTEYPQLFRSLIAVGPFVSGYSSPASEALFGGYGQAREAFERSGSEGAARHFVNIPAFNPEQIGTAVKARLLEICSEYSWWWTTHDDPLQPVEPAGVNGLGRIAVPVLIITGEYDAAACREVATLLEQQVPCCSRVDIDGASHFMLMEQPDVVSRAILEFIGGVGILPVATQPE